MITLERAAMLLNTRPAEVRKLIRAGKIHASKTDNGYMIDMMEIRRRMRATDIRGRKRTAKAATENGSRHTTSARKRINDIRILVSAINSIETSESIVCPDVARYLMARGRVQSSLQKRSSERNAQYSIFKSAFRGGTISKDAILNSWAEELRLENGCQSERDAI